MTAATTPSERRNAPHQLRHFLIICWLLLVLQIWFASESDDFLDPQHRRDHDGGFVGDIIDMPRREEEIIRRVGDGMMIESNHLQQFGDGNNFIAMQEIESAEAPIEPVQIPEAMMTDNFSDAPHNYTQGVNVGDDNSADVNATTNDTFSISQSNALAASANDGNSVDFNATMTDTPVILSNTIQNNTQYANTSIDKFADVHASNDNFTKSILNSKSNSSGEAYDCSIVWVRVPKTASTSIYEVFMRPLATWFQNTHIDPNTCIAESGGCSLHWNVTSDRNETLDNKSSIINFETACIGASNGECFEYDNATRTTNFGPPGKISESLKKNLLLIGKGKANLKRQFDQNDKFVRRVEDGTGIFSPSVHSHVGLHTSLLNNILPSKPMVFSAFREPRERLLSSFHHGIIYGAGRPGEVKSCNLDKPGLEVSWRERVATARKLATVSNSTVKYQSLLRYYLERCENAAWNVYTQFLDPSTKDVSVALHNLEQYVIVGMQTNITETIQLWSNMTMRNCRNRPNYDLMRSKILLKPFINKTYTETREKVSITVKESVVLDTPDVEQFDDDLKHMFNEFIREDEIIYQRAKELYARQLEMMLN